jgi:dihydroorotate dehydrogenase (fumarate)
MVDLSTSYLGLQLKNPFIIASSKLTATTEKVAQWEASGAGAVVLKSLFEEQILSDSGKMMENLDYTMHADAFDFFSGTSKNYYLDDYLRLVEECKAATTIPVIASINCVSAGSWLDYAARFENVGADALEVNLFLMPADASKTGEEYKNSYLEIAEAVKKHVSIPVALKIGSHFTGLANMIRELCKTGIDGLVLFNRFYRPDFDIDSMKLKAGPIFSEPNEYGLSLQWIALMSGEIDCDLAAATGIHDGTAAIKQLLAGAKAIQLCSALFKYGQRHVEVMKRELSDWMVTHEFEKIDGFCGTMCQENSTDPEAFERSQYIKALVGIT